MNKIKQVRDNDVSSAFREIANRVGIQRLNRFSDKVNVDARVFRIIFRDLGASPFFSPADWKYEKKSLLEARGKQRGLQLDWDREKQRIDREEGGDDVPQPLFIKGRKYE